MSVTPTSPTVGFTLVEMLVVLIILAGAASLLAGAVMQRSDEPTLEQSAKSLVAHLRRARIDALATRQRQALVLDPEQRLFWRSSELATKHVLPASADVTATTARPVGATNQPAIAFFADGTSSGGTILLKQTARTVRIEIDWMTGAAHVSETK